MSIRLDLKRILEEKGLSVRRLSIESGVRRQSIMRFLAGGNIHITNLEKILSSVGYAILLRKKNTASNIGGKFSFDPNELGKFCKKNSITRLAVFGSVLRTDFKKDSDIDLLIKFAKPVSFFGFAKIEKDLQKIFKTTHKLDIVTANSISPLIADEIKGTSEVIYEEAA